MHQDVATNPEVEVGAGTRVGAGWGCDWFHCGGLEVIGERGSVYCGTVDCGTVDCGTVDSGTVDCVLNARIYQSASGAIHPSFC